jgi:hypothetical protein
LPTTYATHQITARFGWSGKDLKIILAPAILGGMLLISWFRFWRDAKAGGGVAAGFFGAGVVLLLVVQLLLPQVGVAAERLEVVRQPCAANMAQPIAAPKQS